MSHHTVEHTTTTTSNFNFHFTGQFFQSYSRFGTFRKYCKTCYFRCSL